MAATPRNNSPDDARPPLETSEWGGAQRLTPLPRPLTSFVGRETEVGAAVEFLTAPAARLLTLTGPGGVGKSRLALEVAERLAAGFPDGVAFVALAPVTDAAHVPAAIASAIGLSEIDGLPLGEQLAFALARRRLLLVLDNVEQVIGSAPALAALLAAAPGLKVLATSRVPLRIAGEQELLVPPLSLPAGGTASPAELASNPAVALFVQRARTVRASFVLDQVNAESVAEVCRRLDGLPLAIELAAARSKVLSPSALLARLSPGLDLLSDGPRDQPERLQTMRAAISWSYDLLMPTEQALFRRLAVFAAGFDLEGAESVGSRRDDQSTSRLIVSSTSVFDGVASLVDRSLLVQQEDAAGEPRFAMLTTIRSFALERLVEAGEEEAAHRALVDWCVKLAGEEKVATLGLLETSAHDRVEAEFDNVRAAFAWLDKIGDANAALHLAGLLGSFWYFRGHANEGRDRLTRALDRASAAPAALSARARYWLGSLTLMDLDNPRSNVWLEESLELYAAMSDRESIISTTILLGAATEYRGDDEGAIAHFERALALSRDLGDPRLTLWSLINLADGAYRKGDRERSAALAAEALTTSEHVGERMLRIYALLVAFQARLDQGDIAEAARLTRECLRLCNAAGDRLGLIAALVGLSAVQLAQGNAERAARVLGGLDAIREQLGSSAPLNHGLHRRTVAAARSTLTEQAYTAAWETGRTMTTEQVVAEALAPANESIVQPRSSTTRSAADPARLTTREREVLRLLIDGLTDRQIAETLFISHRTTQVHVGSIFSKLGVNTRTAAAAAAHRLGLDLGQP